MRGGEEARSSLPLHTGNVDPQLLLLLRTTPKHPPPLILTVPIPSLLAPLLPLHTVIVGPPLAAGTEEISVALLACKE